MVGSLSNLNRLEISKCHKMEQILKATEEGRNRNEVMVAFRYLLFFVSVVNYTFPPQNKLKRHFTSMQFTDNQGVEIKEVLP